MTHVDQCYNWIIFTCLHEAGEQTTCVCEFVDDDVVVHTFHQQVEFVCRWRTESGSRESDCGRLVQRISCENTQRWSWKKLRTSWVSLCCRDRKCVVMSSCLSSQQKTRADPSSPRAGIWISLRERTGGHMLSPGCTVVDGKGDPGTCVSLMSSCWESGFISNIWKKEADRKQTEAEEMRMSTAGVLLLDWNMDLDRGTWETVWMIIMKRTAWGQHMDDHHEDQVTRTTTVCWICIQGWRTRSWWSSCSTEKMSFRLRTVLTSNLRHHSSE